MLNIDKHTIFKINPKNIDVAPKDIYILKDLEVVKKILSSAFIIPFVRWHRLASFLEKEGSSFSIERLAGKTYLELQEREKDIEKKITNLGSKIKEMYTVIPFTPSKKQREDVTDWKLDENNLMEKSITSVNQDNSIATQAPKVQPAERIINWNDTAVNITNKVRGLNPKPGTHTTLNGKWIKIFHTSPVNENYQLTPGTIIARTKMRLLVQTGEGGLFIQSLQKEGKKRMDIQEFLQGASIKEGDQLGS